MFDWILKCSSALFRSSCLRCFVTKEKVFWEISRNSQENTCPRVSFSIKLQAWTYSFIKKETLAQVFSCECCELSKKTFFTEQFWATVSALLRSFSKMFYQYRWSTAGFGWTTRTCWWRTFRHYCKIISVEFEQKIIRIVF